MDISLQIKQNYKKEAFLVYEQQIYGTVYQRMLLKHQPLIRLKVDLIDIAGKETYYLMLTLTIPMCMHNKEEEIIFDRFVMIDNVVVMGQLYGGEYLVEDFWSYCSILGALDRYCRNED